MINDLFEHPLITKALQADTDIRDLLPILTLYARNSQRVVELGTRYGTSALAFLRGCPEVHGYDIHRTAEADVLCQLFGPELVKTPQDRRFHLHIVDSLQATIPECDLMLVDTIHTHDQVIQELNRHQGQVRRWIMLHDTLTFGAVGSDGKPGINLAIGEFVRDTPEWKITTVLYESNGLTILSRGDQPLDPSSSTHPFG